MVYYKRFLSDGNKGRLNDNNETKAKASGKETALEKVVK